MIEPIFEANFLPVLVRVSPEAERHDALEVIRLQGCDHRYVVDADIKSYFDNIHHGKLLKRVERRISDRRVLKLIGSG